MAAPKDTTWKIQPHTQAKHDILRRYLSAWFPILGKNHERIFYIDGFCGPGRYQDEEDGSPIIVLKEAAKQSSLQNTKIIFFFIDERKDRIEQLENILKVTPVPNNFHIYPVIATFENQFQYMLNKFGTSQKQPPTFAFIDPFGFSGVPFNLVSQLLEKPRTEVFINIMVDFANRFLTHPNDKTKQQIVDLFGTTEALDIAFGTGNRIEKLRLLYQKQLQKHAKYVNYFEMQGKNGRTIYYLFFATNNLLGYKKMKIAFWDVDETSGFKFSDATNPDQLMLFEPGEHVPSMLAKELQQQFKSETVLAQDIREFVNEKTRFLESHTTKALKLLEGKREIRVSTRKQDNTKRTSGFPNGVIVTFKPHRQQSLF